MATRVQVTGQLLLRNSEPFTKRSRKFSVRRHTLVDNFVHLRLKKKVSSASSSPPRIPSHCLYLLQTFLLSSVALCRLTARDPLCSLARINLCIKGICLMSGSLFHRRGFHIYPPPCACKIPEAREVIHNQANSFTAEQTKLMQWAFLATRRQKRKTQVNDHWYETGLWCFCPEFWFLATHEQQQSPDYSISEWVLKCTESYWWRWWKTLGGGAGQGGSILFIFFLA